ncbi:hypothetical protein VW23_027065 [Devosia insulae DS-56]|uniref:SH3b domain-containing protein n=1 Tax=Devosia insulae DS-56 TaxID=1116389 RepID=A0A1E5XKU2_9HYPH|nr:SH3 domain-containing protein [Devosia insulae]OEO29114.1 hypothetical protein VW23_027065 [Devosia insulae DS-56]
MARSILSFVLFATTLLSAGFIITAGAVFTVERLADAVSAAPVKSAIRPSYVAALPPAKAIALDIARFVPVTPAAPATPEMTAPAAASFTHEVVVDALWVRAKPSKRSAKLVALARGARLSVDDTEGNWAAVTGPNGGKGWVYADYLRPLQH